MSPEISRLLADIDAYCAERGIRPSTFGRLAANDGKFYDRLKGGGDCLQRTIARVRRYMRENPPAADPAPRRERSAA